MAGKKVIRHDLDSRLVLCWVDSLGRLQSALCRDQYEAREKYAKLTDSQGDHYCKPERVRLFSALGQPKEVFDKADAALSSMAFGSDYR